MTTRDGEGARHGWKDREHMQDEVSGMRMLGLDTDQDQVFVYYVIEEAVYRVRGERHWRVGTLPVVVLGAA